MSKRNIFLLILSFAVIQIHAQKNKFLASIKDSVVKSRVVNNPNSKDEQISDEALYKKINQTFGTIATGQSDATNLVNYGSFEPVNGMFKFNFVGRVGAIKKQQAAVFSISAAGNITSDNIGVLFNNSKFNSGASLKGKLYLPIRAFTEIHISGNEEEAILEKIQLVKNQKMDDIEKAKLEFGIPYLSMVISRNKAALEVLVINLKSFKDSLIVIEKVLKDIHVIPMEILKLGNTGIDLSKKILAANREQDELIKSISLTENLIKSEANRKIAINKISDLTSDTAYQKKIKALEMTVSVQGKKFIWLTIIGEIGRKKYYTFIDSLSFDNQFRENKLTTSLFGLELNYLGYSKGSFVAGEKPHIHFGNIGIVRMKTNNIDDLSTTELSDSRRYSSTDTTRTLVTKYNVYSENIIEYNAWKLYLNYYYYFGENRTLALHFFPDIQFRNTKQNPLNIGGGVIFGLKNKKDNTAFNVEFYGKLLDVGSALPNRETNFSRRNEIGLNFGIPLNF